MPSGWPQTDRALWARTAYHRRSQGRGSRSGYACSTTARRCCHVDDDDDERAHEKALVEPPGLTVDIERTVPAHATPRTDRERCSELGSVDGEQRRGNPHICRALAEQATVRRPGSNARRGM